MTESVIEKCTKKVSNSFKLALLASQRTHDLNTGAGSPVEVAKLKGHKNTVVSLYEIAETQVDVCELFSLLVSRCKEYMKGNVSDAYRSNTNKLEKLLNFLSDNQSKMDTYTDQKKSPAININNGEIEIKK